MSDYVSGAAGLAVGLGALAVLDAERGAPEANITTLRDALWWASTTVTTVGYSDRFPVTGEGRLVPVVLMVLGIGHVGTVTAVAAWLLGRVSDEATARRDTPARRAGTGRFKSYFVAGG